MKAGWQIKKLGDICNFEGGSQPPKAEFIYQEAVDYVRFLQIRDFGSDKNITYVRHSKKNRLCSENDILIGRYGASVGKILSGKAGAYNVALMKTLPNQEIVDRSWFHKFLISDDFQHPLLKVADRSAQAGFSKDDIYNFPVPIPPLPEQQRIVTLLDEAFDGIATAKSNAENNLQNARAIFESHLDAVLSRNGAGYTATTLGAEVDLLPGYAFPSGGYTDAIDAVRLLRGDNIMQGYFRWEEAKGWPSGDCESYSRFALQEGDVVIAMDRPWVKAGLKRAQICEDDLPSLLVQRTSRLRTLGRMRMDFLSHLTGSQAFSRHPLEVQTGIGVPHISGKQIESFKFMLPPLSDQESIANTLNALLANAQRLEEIYEEKISALDALKKSLLHRAFNGEL